MKLDREEVALRLFCARVSGIIGALDAEQNIEMIQRSFEIADHFLSVSVSHISQPAPSRLADALEWMQEYIHKSSHGNKGNWRDCQRGMCKNIKKRLADAARGDTDGGDDAEASEVRGDGEARGENRTVLGPPM